jgi:hypothetical protein
METYRGLNGVFLEKAGQFDFITTNRLEVNNSFSFAMARAGADNLLTFWCSPSHSKYALKLEPKVFRKKFSVKEISSKISFGNHNLRTCHGPNRHLMLELNHLDRLPRSA